MKKLVLNKAKSWGFSSQMSQENNWQILPTQPEESWKLTEFNSWWILSINNVPQINLDSEEAIAFLARRYGYQIKGSKQFVKQQKYKNS